jgi:hypothetical protein
MRDLRNNLSAAVTLAPAVRTSDATGTTVDLLGYESAAVYLQIGAGGIVFSDTNRIDFVMEHSEDASTWTAVTSDHVRRVTVATGGIVRSLIEAHAAATVTEIGYIGGRRYVRLSADFGGTQATGTAIAALVVRGHPHSAPTP